MEKSTENNKEGNKTKLFGKDQYKNLAIPISIVIAGLLISGAVLYSRILPGFNLAGQIQKNSQATDIVEVNEDDDPFLGSENAKITIIEFSDYQCPFCRRFWTDSLPQLKEEYINTGKVKFVYRDFPLSSIHPAAQAGAEAAECAKDQGKYWEMHDKLFQEQSRLGSDDLKKWAAEIGLNGQEFNQCFDSRKYKSEVEKDHSDGVKAGVTGTPTFFINGRKVVGAVQYQTLKSIIEEELNK